MMAEPPTCKGTRKDGARCQSTARNEQGFCFVHGETPETVAEARRRGGIASGETRRELAKSGRQLLRKELEAEVQSIVGAFRDGTKALAACPHCGGDLPDVRARIQAAAECSTRATASRCSRPRSAERWPCAWSTGRRTTSTSRRS